MTTGAKTPSPTAGARKVLAKVRSLLPMDARWYVDYFEEDGIYLLDIYAEGLDRMKIHKASSPILSELGRRGLPMAIIMSDTRALKWHPEWETYPVHEPAGTE